MSAGKPQFSEQALQELVARINANPDLLDGDWTELVEQHFELPEEETRKIRSVSTRKKDHIQDFMNKAAAHIRQGGSITARLVERAPHEQANGLKYDIDIELADRTSS